MLLRAIEEKTFLPLGSDKEVSSSFQLICGTNQDLETAVATGNPGRSASRSLADAGKKLFAVSRKAKKTFNDSDRLSKYLAHFGLDFHADIKHG